MARTDIYNTEKVHKVCLIIITAVVLLLSVQSFFSGGVGDLIDTAEKGAVVLVLSIVIFFLPIHNYVKGFFLCTIPGLVTVVLFYLTGFSIDKHYIIIASLTMAALYFKKELLLAFGIVMDVTMLTVYFLRPENIAGTGGKLVDFVSLMILFNTSIAVLYLLNYWGRKLLIEATNKEKEGKVLLDKLKNTFSILEGGTNSLDNEIDGFNKNITQTKDASMCITTAMQEMTKVIQEEAQGIVNINSIMSSSIENIEQALKLSNNIISQSSEMIDKVEDGWNKISLAGEQVEMVNLAMDKASDTVNLLQNSMGDIVASLDGIRQIAVQTNMLALNAAIESARAGEQGKGFAVVSEEVRKLAEQSTKMVNDISTVIKDITGKSLDTYNVVTAGSSAANTSKSLINDISEYFGEVKHAFANTNKEISDGLKMFSDISQNYTDTQKQMESIASISGENAASVEEILATVEDVNQQIIQYSNSVEKIGTLSKDLKRLIISDK